jgi:APA family basic amino acid/polyamine antiporter
VNLPLLTQLRFAVWLAIGLALYFFYGFRHSRQRGETVRDGERR